MERTTLIALLLWLGPAALAQDISQAEYWIDTDNGFGTYVPVSGFPADTDVTATFPINIAGLLPGMHTVAVRTKDANGHWSHTNHFPLYVAGTIAGAIVRVEHFWGDDPGFGNAQDTLLANPAGNLPNLQLIAQVPLDAGPVIDTIYFRSLDSRGRWSHTNHIVVDVSEISVEELSSAGISVFPNPFAGSINVKMTNAKPVRMIVYDPQGRQVVDRMVTGNERIDLEGQTSGAYTVFFWTEMNVIHRVTLIKQ